MKRSHDRNSNQIPNRRYISRHNREAGDPLAEITHKAEISHNAATNYHLTKEAPRCPERPRTPLRPLFALGASTHAALQSQCLRPAPPGPKHTLDTPPQRTQTPSANFWAVSQAESVRNATQRRRFPRSVELTANNPRQKPPRSPGPMTKSAPISCETAQNPQGRDRRRSRGSR